MPDIQVVTPVRYQPLDPYHVEYDNRPIDQLRQIIEVVNDQVDNDADVLRIAQGDAGNIAARLNQSLLPNGDLNPIAINEANHNIATHNDGSVILTSDEIAYFATLGTGYTLTNPVTFVRMLNAERAKLALISDEATALKIEFPGTDISVIQVFSDELLQINDSDTVTWSVDGPTAVSAHLAFPPSSAHEHFYDLIPTPVNISSPDYINYNVTSMATPFIDGSLRVYVNSVRLSQNASVYVPASTGPSGTWTLTTFTATPNSGTFSLNRALNHSDVIIIDFDIALG